MVAAGQRAGPGARRGLLALIAALCSVGLAAASPARAAAGSLASIERDPNFAWSTLNITAGAAGFDAIADDPIPWSDAATGELCVAATSATPAGHVITWCRDSDDTWHQWDMTTLWGGPAAVGDIREVAYSGQSVLVFRDASGEMWSLTRNATGSWTPVNLTATYSLAALGSDPWPLIDSATGQLCAVATASNPAGHVIEWCHQSDGTWLQSDLTAVWGGPAAVSTIVPGFDPAVNESNVFFRDASGELWSLTRQSGGNWVPLNITASSSGLSPIASDPMPVIDPPTGQLCVAAVLANPAGHVAEFCRPSGGGWLQFDLIALYGGPAAAGNVEPVVDPQLHQTDFFFHDATGSLWSMTRGGDGRWTPSQITPSGGAPLLVSDPEALVDPQSNNPVVMAGLGPPATPTTPSPPVTVTTPVPQAPGAIHARFVINWGWDGHGIVLRTIHVRGLPHGARVSVSCAGPQCPHIRASATGPRRIVRLLTALRGRRFAPGDLMGITVDRARTATRAHPAAHPPSAGAAGAAAQGLSVVLRRAR